MGLIEVKDQYYMILNHYAELVKIRVYLIKKRMLNPNHLKKEKKRGGHLGIKVRISISQGQEFRGQCLGSIRITVWSTGNLKQEPPQGQEKGMEEPRGSTAEYSFCSSPLWRH